MELVENINQTPNSPNIFCNSNIQSSPKCFSFPTFPCLTCNLYFCPEHLWSEVCLSCLRQSIRADLYKSPKIFSESLVIEINALEAKNDELSLEITKKKFCIKQLESDLKNSKVSNADFIKTKIQNEKKNRKNFEETAANMKKAVSELKIHENIMGNSAIGKDKSWYVNEIQFLIEKNLELTDKIDVIRLDLRQSVPYVEVRNFICSGCSVKIKEKFADRIFDWAENDRSILQSVIYYRKKAKVRNKEDACNCLMF